ncbi:pentatricopeptide repeat-containing protein [Tanacetum coccineum]
MSETDITSDSNIIPYSQYLSETQQETVQNSNSSAQQDVLILSMFDQLTTQVTHCTTVNKALTTELDRYKEEVKDLKEKQNVENSFSGSNEQFAEIVRLKQNLFEQVQEKDCLMKTVSELKNELKLEENRNIDREIALEKKIKQLDNIIFKRGQSAQTRVDWKAPSQKYPACLLQNRIKYIADQKLHEVCSLLCLMNGSSERRQTLSKTISDVLRVVELREIRILKVHTDNQLVIFTRGYGLDVFGLFCEMNEDGVKPDRFMYTYVLKACVASDSEVSLLAKGKEIHAHILRHGFEVNVHSAMIACYAKNGRAYEALQLFGEMMVEVDDLTPNSVTMVSVLQACGALAALISSYGMNGFGEQAIEIYNEMLRNKIKRSPMDLVNKRLQVVLCCKGGVV